MIELDGHHPRTGNRRPTFLVPGLVAAAWVALTAFSEQAQAQEGDRAERTRVEIERDCHCVDGEGEPVDDCRCFRIPPMPDLSRIREQVERRVVAAPGRAWLGVSVDVTQDDADDGRGVLLREVMEGSPAWTGGLRAGDVVRTVDGRSVLDPLGDESSEDGLDLSVSVPVQRFLTIIRALEPGGEVRIGYRRNGEVRDALVTDVFEGAGLDLEAGDVILRIGEREVGKVADVSRILRSYRVDEDVEVTVRRRGEVVRLEGTRRPLE